MGVSTVDSLSLKTYEGNTRTFLFKLRTLRTRQPHDVSAVDKFKFEVKRQETEDDTPFAPIEGFSSDAGADYVNGEVPITVLPTGTSPVAAEVGTYLFSLTHVTGSVEVTIAVGQLEVAERPGFPNP